MIRRLRRRLIAAKSFRCGPKVFCIGRNKTGTTSLARALALIGYRVGRQRDAELLIDDWARRDFRGIISYCRSADAFQDVPFSLDFTYQAVDAAFPGSKFVLTVRSSVDEWYESLVRFHSKCIGKSTLPTVSDLQSYGYVSPGWLWKCQQVVYGVTTENLYDEELYKSHYLRHNDRVRNYFQHRPQHLLEINLASSDSMERLAAFLGRNVPPIAMPHLNASR